MLASRSSCTHICQSAFCTGAGFPLLHCLGTSSRAAVSAIARPLFSTASHPPYALVNGSDDVDWCVAGLKDAGSSTCAVKMTLDCGYNVPRISCSMVAYTRGWTAGACAATDATHTNARTTDATRIMQPPLRKT